MSDDDSIRLGIVGAGGRGGSFQEALAHSDTATVHAVCDLDEDGAERAREAHGAAEAYTDYDEMLWESDLDGVIIGTPQPLHVTQSVAALNQDLHVLSEVPAGINVGECRDLVEACERSAGTYMLAENYIYRKPVMLVKELVEAGLFGEVYYAVGEYLHEVRGLFERTKWRRTWAAGRNGNNYPTHSLGPILTWMPNDRVSRVSCEGSGHHYTDARGDSYEEEDTTVFLGKTEEDRLVSIRRDVFSERPHAMDNYQLQGTKGSYESARASGESDRVWLEAHEEAEDSGEYAWRDLAEFEEEYLPEAWRDPPEGVEDLGHGGGDYFLVQDFLRCIAEGESPPIGIHRAMDMTLPGLASMESIENDGEWVEVPDSRQW